MNLLELEARWKNLTNKFGYNSSFWKEILQSYSEPSRHYHTLSHISSCLVELDEIKFYLEEPEVVELAIWFHDIVYNPLSKTNEEESAQKAFDFSMPNEKLGKKLSEFIILTKTHNNTSLTSDQSYFLDIDLSILGKNYTVFKKYDTDIRQEYSVVPDEVYYPARKSILQEFLNREKIFVTNYFHKKYDVSARLNLKSIIEAL